MGIMYSIWWGEAVVDIVVSCGGEVFVCGVRGNVGMYVVMMMGDWSVSGVALVVLAWLGELNSFIGRGDLGWKIWEGNGVSLVYKKIIAWRLRCIWIWKRKIVFIKYDMSKNDNFITRQLKTCNLYD